MVELDQVTVDMQRNDSRVTQMETKESKKLNVAHVESIAAWLVVFTSVTDLSSNTISCHFGESWWSITLRPRRLDIRVAITCTTQGGTRPLSRH